MGQQQFRRVLRAVAVVALLATGLTVVWVAPASADPSTFVFDNGKLRFGGGGHGSATAASREASIDSFGNLKQPYYWSSNQNKWFKLTYSSYPLDFAVGTGSAGGNWTGATITENPALTGQVIDDGGFVTDSTSGGSAVGHGRLRSTGTVDAQGTSLQVTNTYDLGATASFVKITTKIQNVDSHSADNVNLWVGTRDDWVGGTDSPTKTKGNLVDGAFAPITQATTPAAALRITSANEGVLFYSTTPGTNTSIHSCCSFSNAYDVNPTSSAMTLTGDGSYALHLPAGTLAAGASAEIVWYYAAGTLADLASVVGEVAAAATARPEVGGGNGQVTIDWEEPTSSDPITDYAIRWSSDGGTTWTEHRRGSTASPLTETITGLSNGTSYLFQVAAVTGTAPSEVVAAWSPSSTAVTPGLPTNQVAPVVQGTAAVGSTLSVVDPDSNWTNNAPGSMTASYQWLLDGVAVPGATAATLELTDDAAGKAASVTARRTNAVGHTDVTTATTAVPGPARLTSLSTSAGTLAPGFTATTTHYAVTVPSGSATLSLTTLPVDAGATVEIDGTSVDPDAANAVTIPFGTTTVRVRVAYAGRSTTYVLTVTRPMPPVAAPTTTTTVPRSTPPTTTPPARPTEPTRPAPPILGLGTGTGTGSGTGTGTGTGATAPTALYIDPRGTASEVKLPRQAPTGNVSAAVAVSSSDSIAVTPSGQVFTTNPALDFGHVPASRKLNAPVTNVGLRWTRKPTASDAETAAVESWEPSGYWLAAADGGVFAFGSARFWGSMGATPLNKHVVGIAPTPSGDGYWLVAADGGVFTFGDARFFGSLGSTRLSQPIVSIVPSATGRGYLLIAVDGGVFAFGDAAYHGSGVGTHRRFIGAAPTPTGGGYWLVGDDRRLLPFGDAAKES